MKCRKCGQEIFLPFQCPYCGDKFCTLHRLPENHGCPRMELARARRNDDTTVFQAPQSYEYKVTYGMRRNVRGHIYFSAKEIKHLLAATLLVIGIGFSIGLFSDIFMLTGWTGMIFLAVTLAFSFLVHELAHKIVAQRRGLWAEFRLTVWGAALTLISVISPLFKIIAPGAVMISGYAKADEIAKISIAGPITNIILGSILLTSAFVPNPYSSLLFLLSLWNGFIALFNLIPIGILDGYKIFRWNKKMWASIFTLSLILTGVPYVVIAA